MKTKTMMKLMALVLLMFVNGTSQTWALNNNQDKTFKKTKMSPWLQERFLQEQMAVKKNGGPKRIQGRRVRNYTLTLVKSTDEAATIRQQGGVVLQDFGNNICAAFLPIDKLGELNQSPNILRMEANAPSQLMNDTSVVILNVYKARGPVSASGLPHAFTGKGVVAGVMDVGIDFTHPAFRNDDGTSRIKWFWDPMAPNTDTDMLGMIYTSPAEVLAARCCSNSDADNHGTHVMGSLTGRGLDNRYVGMAPEADIMSAYLPLGFISDEFIARVSDYIVRHLDEYPFLASAGEKPVIDIEPSSALDLVALYQIFKAADAIGQPCVVNWSFGSSASFLNDNSLFEEIFNQLVGPGHIVVASAGNSGYTKNYLAKEPGERLEQDIYYSCKLGSFLFQLRTEPDEPSFKFGLTFDNIADTIMVNTGDILAATTAGDTLTVQLPKVKVMYIAVPGAFDKQVYNIQVRPTESSVYNLHGKVIVEESAKMDMLGIVNMLMTVKFSEEDATNSRGCQIGTLGAPANLERIITVGAMHHRTEFTNINHEQRTYKELGSEEGHLASFSSCGPSMNGRMKPDVVAPGHNIISCLNSFYLKDDDEKATAEEVLPRTVYTSSAFGKNYSMWAMSGTSMASPITAGIVALWLQAKPDLTPEDIFGVIERTSHQPEPEFSGTDKNIYYGWGEIDAYAGLLDILDIPSNIPELSMHQPAGISIRLSGHTLIIDGAEDGTSLTVYDLNGRPVFQTVTCGTSVQLPNLPTGVYAVQLGQKGSTLIRI